MRYSVVFLAGLLFVAACSDSESYEVGVVKPLMVASVTPGGADDVPLDAAVKVRFSDNVIVGTLTADTVLLTDAKGALVEAAFSYDADAFELTLQPAKPLAYSAVYNLTVTQKVKRKSDSAVLAKELPYTFKTMDPPALAIIRSEPSPGAKHVGQFVDSAGNETSFGNKAEVTIVIHFSEGIDQKSLTDKTFTLKDEKGSTVAGTFAWESSDGAVKDLRGNLVGTDDILTFTPNAPLALSTEFTVTLTGTFDGVRTKRATEESGYFAKNVEFKFRTIDPPPLRVIYTAPSTDAVDVGTLIGPLFDRAAQTVTIRFSEGVATDSVLAALRVYPEAATTAMAGAVTFGSSGAQFYQQNDIVTFTPADWALAQDYVARLAASAKSFRATATGGSLGLDFTARFDVRDAAPLVLNAAAPGAGAGVSGMYITAAGEGDTAQFDLVLQFSEDVRLPAADANSIENPANLAIYAGVVPVTPLGFAYSADGTQVTVDLPDLGLSTNVFVHLEGDSLNAGFPSTGVASVRGQATRAWFDDADDWGGYLLADVDFAFWTPDPPALSLILLSPAATVAGSSPADNIAVNTTFTLQFSDPLTYSAAQIAAFVYLTQGGTPVPVTYAVGGTQVTLTPVAALKFSETYELTLVGGPAGLHSWRATSAAGWLVPASTVAYTFKTVDPATLSIWATSPSDQEEAYGISVSDVTIDGSNVQILFSAPLDHAVFESNVKAEKCADALCASVTPHAIQSVSYVTYPAAEKAVLDLGALDFDAYYQITVTGGAAGVRSLENTTQCAVACEGGYLPMSHTIRFGTRSIPPLKVSIVTPPNNSTGIEHQPAIVIDFSYPLNVATLTPAAFYVTDVTSNLLVHRFGDGVKDAYYPVSQTAAIVLNGPLAPDHEFNVVVISTVRGADDRTMVGDAKFNFHTQKGSILQITDPYNGESNVEVTLSQRDTAGLFSIYYDGVVTTPPGVSAGQLLSVTYSTVQGITVLRGVVTAVTATTTTWYFDPDTGCTPLGDPLVPNTTYYVNIADQVWRTSDLIQLAGGYQARFKTVNTAPSIAGVTARGKVPGRADLVIDLIAGTDSLGGGAGNDVPVIATYAVEFDRIIDTSTLVASAVANPAADTLLLRKQDGSYANLSSLAFTTVNGRTVATFAADDTLNDVAAPDLEYDKQYTLLVRTGVREASPVSTPLAESYSLTFRTSVAPLAYLLPTAADGASKGQQYAPSVTFSVAIAPESLVDTNYYLVKRSNGGNCVDVGGSVATPALIDLGADARSAAILPAPLMEATEIYTVSLVVGADGPRDERGNPFPGSPLLTNYSKQFCTNSSDNGTSGVSVTSRNPAVGGTAAGHGPIKLNLAVSATLGDVLPTTIKQDSFWVFYDAGYTKPVTGAASFSQAGEYAAVFKPAAGVYFEAGRTYYVRNNSNLASSVRNPCDASCIDYTFTGEAVAPTVTARTPSGAGANALGPVTVGFSEPMRPETVTPNSAAFLTVTYGGGTIVSGIWTLSADGMTATFTPADPLTSGVTYSINVGAGVTDLAGNMVGALAAQTFTVETTQPTIVSVVPSNGASGVLLGSNVTVTFSEVVDPASITASLIGPAGVYPGSLRLVTSGDPLDPANTLSPSLEALVCAYVNDAVVTLDPVYDFISLQPYSLGVSTTVTDQAGNRLSGAGSLTTFTAQ